MAKAETDTSAPAPAGRKDRSGAGWTVIRARLALAFGTLLVLIVTLGAVAIRQLDTVSAVTDEMRRVALPKLIALQNIDTSLSTHAILARSRIETRDFRKVAQIERDMREVREGLSMFLAEFQSLRLSAAEAATVAALRKDWDTHLATLDEVFFLLEQGELSRANLLFEEEASVAVIDAGHSVDLLMTGTEKEARAIAAVADTRYRQARFVTAGTILLGIAATVVAMLWASRSITRPLLQISAAMRRITHIDTPQDAPDLPQRMDEIEILSDAATAFRDSVLATRALAADLELQRSLLDTTVRNMPVGLCMFDTKEELVVANPVFRSLYELDDWRFFPGTPQARILEHISKRLEDDDRDGPLDADMRMAEIAEARQPKSATWRLTNGRTVATRTQPTPDGWMMIAEDISERVAAEENIRHLARHDALTGLPNRRTFSEEIDAVLAAADPSRPSAVMFIDLDRFKWVNDTLGHPVGDALLKQVAGRLQWAVGDHDTLARFGGDEFAVIQRDCRQPEGAQALGDRIIDLLSTPFEIDGNEVRIGGSVGIALAPGDGACAEEVLKNADVALYCVKAAGKGHCQFYRPEMRDHEQAKLQLERDLRQALSDDVFTMHYQPIYDIRTGKICAAEALLRWKHPTHGMVPPAEFVPMAEELGLMSDLGQRVLDLACTEAATWPDHIRLAVNIAPAQFTRNDVLKDILTALDRSGLPPERLEVDITESVLVERSERTLDILAELHALGVRVALDDFGTGYSSLHYLRAFPFDKVKIDVSFVRKLNHDPNAYSIVRAICALCASLDIDVTAEGIETAEQLETVALDGCREAQGFYLGHPAPAAVMRRQAAGLPRMRSAAS
ncbi:diguanylate cyclase/phosphodiesterase (GGDEF & EAL domains) with PAS/PAC sensor(s) [Rhodovulum sp. P5]|uniref:EAL domain-containing protein n=1 Tax=Rhodovulum sp. P5 TaxID=1564506 RepID=UPI0009C1ACB5|nr:EAL domain-containing protein [Rhodovulum sp. P5]ARE40760.1 diguanylate cyclase/phosphodiesterase (GGDEF & EAL domains) with PAS/PAC sensor(s) [Rhodovulum sp. P5]